jgi:hypothetical protein
MTDLLAGLQCQLRRELDQLLEAFATAGCCRRSPPLGPTAPAPSPPPAPAPASGLARLLPLAVVGGPLPFRAWLRPCRPALGLLDGGLAVLPPCNPLPLLPLPRVHCSISAVVATLLPPGR